MPPHALPTAPPAWLPVLMLLCLLAGCRHPKPEKYADIATLPEGFLGRSYRAFATEEGIVFEIEQIGGLNVVKIEGEVVDGQVYLSPGRISSGAPKTSTLKFRKPEGDLPADWRSHCYWLVEDYYYPVTHSGFNDPAARKATIRCPVILSSR